MKRFDALWLFNGTVWLDYTNNTRNNTAISFISDSVSYFYFGMRNRFIGLYTTLSTIGAYTGLIYEYWDGVTWNKLSLIDTYNWTESKYVRWVLPHSDWMKYNFVDGTPHPQEPPDNVERYWMRIRCTGATATAIMSELRCISYPSYTIPIKVSQFLQFKKDFDYNTTPKDIVVEDLIRRAEDLIDYRTRKSWRFNAVSEEQDPILVDFNRYGMFLRHRNFLKVYAVYLWNGSSWQALVEGRNNDYFVNYNLGLIYFTRLYMLPAIYGMTGRYSTWGLGEFKNSIKVDYVYGRNSETDPEFHLVEDIATKMAAVDILRHHDYSNMIVAGTDKVSLDNKIALLNEEIESKIDNLTGISIV